MKRWEGWIMKDGKRYARLVTGPLRTREDVQQWYQNHPKMAAKCHIEFEELEDKAPVSVAVGDLTRPPGA